MTRRSFLQFSALALAALGLSCSTTYPMEMVRFKVQWEDYCFYKGGTWPRKLSMLPCDRYWNFFEGCDPDLEIIEINWLDRQPYLIKGYVTFTWEDGRTETVRALVKKSEPQKIFALEV